MCGIAGFWSRYPPNGAEQIAGRMADALISRGPDARGTWCDPEVGLALGHRRLSIVDLSSAGSQPMGSADRRWWVTYNGEIYNAKELAEELRDEGVAFRGHSDTEVLVEAIAAWGVEATLPRLNGMFAFGAWDRGDRALFLARDRVGIKPLYYGHCDGSLLFGSELKAIAAFPGFERTISRDAVALFLRHSYVPDPYCIYAGVSKLAPGHLLRVESPDAALAPKPWWDARHVARAAVERRGFQLEEEVIDGFERLARDAVAIRMEADVPLGAFLSGGIDSSTVVALMQAQTSQKVKTFSIGFEEDAFDEAHYARAIAQHLGTDHTEHYLSIDDARDVIPELPRLWDEPFADASQIPTYLVSRIARDKVIVSLSGDGGDELFGGYARYGATTETWNKLASWPLAVRRSVSAALRGAARAARFVPHPFLLRTADGFDYRAARWGQPSIDSLYRLAMSFWNEPERVVRDSRESATAFLDPYIREHFDDPVERMMLIDSISYLPCDILTKVDRASMAVSLEARVPLLDYRLFEYAWRMPQAVRLKRQGSKWPLRSVLARHVPSELFERPKQGFAVPISSWLRGSLRAWAEDLLSAQRLGREGVLDPATVRASWTRFLRTGVGENLIWNVLMFQAWFEENSARAARSAG